MESETLKSLPADSTPSRTMPQKRRDVVVDGFEDNDRFLLRNRRRGEQTTSPVQDGYDDCRSQRAE